MSERIRTIRVTKLSEQGKEGDLKQTTPQERWAMMWQLALDTWAFKEKDSKHLRMQKNIIRVIHPTDNQ